MPTKIKAFYRSRLFWEITVGAALLVCAIVVLAVHLKRPDPVPPELPVNSTAATEPTLPTPLPNPLQPGDFAFKGDYFIQIGAVFE